MVIANSIAASKINKASLINSSPCLKSIDLNVSNPNLWYPWDSTGQSKLLLNLTYFVGDNFFFEIAKETVFGL